MPPPPDSTFSAAESITTHDTLPPSKLIARDNVLLAGLLASFAPSMADAHRLSIDDLHPDRNLLLFLHRLSPRICTDLTGDWLHTHPALTNNYRGLRLFGGENCIALLDEHDVAAMLTNNLGILERQTAALLRNHKRHAEKNCTVLAAGHADDHIVVAVEDHPQPFQCFIEYVVLQVDHCC